MIEINLIPENLRRKRKAVTPAVSSAPKGLPKETMVGIVSGFVILLVVVSILLQVYVVLRVGKRNNLKKEFEDIAADRTAVETMIEEMKQVKTRATTLEKVLGKKSITWADKLNEISDHLPRGAWLTKVALEGDTFVVQGSAVSKTKSEISDVHALAGSLKASKKFMNNLKTLELDMIKTRTVENLSVADFTIKAGIEKEEIKKRK